MLDKAKLMTSSHALPIKIILPANFVLRQCIFFKVTAQCTMGKYQFSRSIIVCVQLVFTKLFLILCTILTFIITHFCKIPHKSFDKFNKSTNFTRRQGVFLKHQPNVRWVNINSQEAISQFLQFVFSWYLQLKEYDRSIIFSTKPKFDDRFFVDL